MLCMSEDVGMRWLPSTRYPRWHDVALDTLGQLRITLSRHLQQILIPVSNSLFHISKSLSPASVLHPPVALSASSSRSLVNPQAVNLPKGIPERVRVVGHVVNAGSGA